MQVLQAGPHKLIYLELQPEMVANIARQAGFVLRLCHSQQLHALWSTAMATRKE